jgi:general secretion pathway protein D
MWGQSQPEPLSEGVREHIDEFRLDQLHKLLQGLKTDLRSCFEQAYRAFQTNQENPELFEELLERVTSLRKEIRELEETWRLVAIEEGAFGKEEHAFWDLGETTLSQMVMEYGGTDYLYIVPPELAGAKISLFSSIPLPRESWSELVDAILIQNGIGIRQIGAYVKQLYILKLDLGLVEAVVGKKEELRLFAPYARLCFLLSPPVDRLRSIYTFLDRFIDPKQTAIQVIGSKITVISHREAIENVLKIYETVCDPNSGKEVRLISLRKLNPEEGEKVITCLFQENAQTNKGGRGGQPFSGEDWSSLIVPQGLILIGDRAFLKRAEQALFNLESEMEDPEEKIVYWYTCRHASPEEVAQVLNQIYGSLLGSAFENTPKNHSKTLPPLSKEEKDKKLPAVAPFIQAGTLPSKSSYKEVGNFVVDASNNSILMVVRKEELSKIKELLNKMDVPKKMVQLDVLLVEKRVTDRKQLGFNVLQIGKSIPRETSVSFDTQERAFHKGILNFVFSRPKGHFPETHFAYNFLLAQEDIKINANPSVLTTNQTPAFVSIVEEISINNGAVKLDTSRAVGVEQSFTRAQYGITIVLTPTIHLPEEVGGKGFVTLKTDLEFDTTQTSTNDRPPVTRRHIENEVCIADGETVILGGLRRKIQEGSEEKIPFLGEIPGVGKLFGSFKNTDSNTEMFVFITPHIIHDSLSDLARIRQEECRKRAGDLPEFLSLLEEAKEKKKQKLFEKSLEMVL